MSALDSNGHLWIADAKRLLDHALGPGYFVLTPVLPKTPRSLHVYGRRGRLIGSYDAPKTHDEVTALAVAIKLEA